MKCESRCVMRGCGFFMAALVLITAVALFPSPSLAGPNAKPNILFILVDDHRWDFLGSAGHPFVKTPQLDRLAAEGIRFSNAFVTSSLCSPSRATFLTGQLVRTHGVKNNLTPWKDENVTFLELFKKAGYATAFLGKWHMPGRLPKLRGVDEFVTFTVQGGQGRYWNCPLIANGKPVPSGKPYITEELTDRAIRFIEQSKDRPFCLYLSHKAAHHAWKPPTDMFDLYSDTPVRYPKESDTWVTMLNGAFWAGTFGTLDHHYRNYCRVIADVDRNVGRLLKRLDELGLKDNTVIVYAGDNGYFWGEHRLVDKRWAYEESIRIPFIVRYPAMIKDPGRVADQMVLNLDLAQSLLEMAGIEAPKNMEGQSLVPILKSASAQGRDAWLYEYYKDFPYNVPEQKAVRTKSHVYIEYQGRRKPELYDLIKDPKERHNLAGSPGDPLEARLKKKLRELDSPEKPK